MTVAIDILVNNAMLGTRRDLQTCGRPEHRTAFQREGIRSKAVQPRGECWSHGVNHVDPTLRDPIRQKRRGLCPARPGVVRCISRRARSPRAAPPLRPLTRWWLLHQTRAITHSVGNDERPPTPPYARRELVALKVRPQGFLTGGVSGLEVIGNERFEAIGVETQPPPPVVGQGAPRR